MPENNTEEKGLGAKISLPDNRRILLARVQAPVDRPKKYRCDDDDIPVEDQGERGSCVGEAEGGEVEYREKRDTGRVTPVAKLELYRQCKAVDGIPNQEGTYPTVAAKIKVDRGAVSKALVPDVRKLSHADTIKPTTFTQEMTDDAGLRVAEGYAFVQPNLEDVLQAIYQNGTFPVTVIVGDWKKCPVKPTPNRGAHRIRLNGYEELDNGDAKIYFRNSWGPKWGKGVDEKGNGWFLWSDYKLNIFEMIVYTDIPEKLILEARATPYKFTRTLKYKMTGEDVKQLQKRLSKEIGKDGKPCYDYRQNGELFFSTYFGRETEKGVQRYQAAKGIVSSGDPETTGYGQLGPTTRRHLNGEVEADLALYPYVEDMKNMLVKIMAAAGNPIVVTDEYRSYAEQDALYAQGRTMPGKIVTNAKGGESAHNFRVAFDVAFSTKNGVSWDGPWDMVGEIGKIIGLEWGGDWASFPDKPHFQFLAGYSLADFRNKTVDLSKFGV